TPPLRGVRRGRGPRPLRPTGASSTSATAPPPTRATTTSRSGSEHGAHRGRCEALRGGRVPGEGGGARSVRVALRAAAERRTPGGGLRRDRGAGARGRAPARHDRRGRVGRVVHVPGAGRSEEHTSELQSRENLVCRLLLEK